MRLCATEPLSRKPLYIYCNNKTFDTPNGASEYAASLLPRAVPITLEEAVVRLKDAILVIEDIQNFDKREQNLLRQLVNFCRRHRCLHLFLATHLVYNTGLWGLLGQVDAVAVLKASKNQAEFMHLARRRNIDKAVASAKWKALMASKPWSLAVFTETSEGSRVTVLETTKRPTLDYLLAVDPEDDEKPEEQRPRLKEEDVKQMLHTFASARRAAALFTVVRANLGEMFDPGDYSVRMRNKKKRVLTCSLFDYVSACLGESPPTLATVTLHTFLCKKLVIPNHLICPRMRKLCCNKKK
jgi:hypothetical protein